MLGVWKEPPQRAAFVLWLLCVWLQAAPGAFASEPAGSQPKDQKAAGEVVPEGDPEASLLCSEPTFGVSSDGVVRVTWESSAPTPPAGLRYGCFLPDEDLQFPLWYAFAPEERGTGKTRAAHAARFSVRPLVELLRRTTGKPHGAARFAVQLRIPAPSGGLLCEERIFGVRWVGERFRRVPAVIEGPFVCLPTTTSVSIVFRTDLSVLGQVVVSDPHGQTVLFQSQKEDTCHEIALDGLYADTVYRYRVCIAPADDAALRLSLAPSRFRTPPGEEFDRPLCFAQAGAAREAQELLGLQEGAGVGHTAALAYRQGAELLFLTGDLLGMPLPGKARTRSVVRSWKRAVSPVASCVPFFFVAGGSAMWQEEPAQKGRAEEARAAFTAEVCHFRNGPSFSTQGVSSAELVYSFDYGRAHFAVVASGVFAGTKGGEGTARRQALGKKQLAWLKQDLASARTRGTKLLFVVGAERGLRRGEKGRLGPPSPLWEQFWRTVSRAGVVAYLCGRPFSYERVLVDEALVPELSGSVWQVALGGAVSASAASAGEVPDQKRGPASRPGAFSLRGHVCLYEITGGEVLLRVLSESGGIVDRVRLFPLPGRPAEKDSSR